LLLALALVAAACGGGQAREHYDKGVEFGNAGLWEQALDELNKAIVLDPKLTEAYMERARALIGLNNLAAARKDLDKVIELDPNSAQGYANRGLVNAQIGDIEKAYADLDKALSLAPDEKTRTTIQGFIDDLESSAPRGPGS
jgi:tetratricopeptide (TPR) repeat protein